MGSEQEAQPAVRSAQRSGDGRARVLLAMEGDADRETFARWFADAHEVLAPEVLDERETALDACVLDREALDRYRDALATRRRTAHPVFLPVLAVVSAPALERRPGASRLDDAAGSVVDDVVTRPVRKVELRRRMANLLERRSLSMDLCEQRERHRRLIEVTPETILTLDADGVIRYANERAVAQFGLESPAEMTGTTLSEWVHGDDRDRVAASLQTGETGDGSLNARVVDSHGEVSHVELAAVPLQAGADSRTQVVLRDVTDRREFEREVERQRDVLRQLNRLNATIRDIDQALVGGSSRAEIEQSVCDELVRTDRYVFAWIGRNRADSEEIEPRATAGRDEGYLEAVTVAPRDGLAPPAARAAASGEPQVVDDVGAAPEFEPWRDAALARELRSVIAVPLRYDETGYGVLTIYAASPGAFDEREQSVLSELGSTIAHAISAAESRRALQVDRHREVEFVIEGGGFLAEASERFECAFELQGAVRQPDGGMLEYYVSAVDEPGAVVAGAEEADDVSLVRQLGEHDGRSQFEIAFESDLVTRTFGDVTASVRSLRVESGRYALTAEVPYDVDMHTLVSAVEGRHESVSLRAQREAERSLRTEQETRQAFVERLTDRQWSVLQTAYYAGYFDWPRGSSGEEVAESLGISPSTLHEHLRVAQRKLLATLLE